VGLKSRDGFYLLLFFYRDDASFLWFDKGKFMIDVFFAALLAAFVVLFSSALMIAGVLFIDRREYVRKEGLDPLRVIIPPKAQPSPNVVPVDVAAGLDNSEWI